MSRFAGWGHLSEAQIEALHQGAQVPSLPAGEGTPKRQRLRLEDQFIAALIQAAQVYGWLAYHPLPARTTKGYRTALQGDAGYFDLTLAKAGHPLLLLEAKTAQGRLTLAQQHWHEAVSHAEGHRVMVVRPAMWAEIEALLRGH